MRKITFIDATNMTCISLFKQLYQHLKLFYFQYEEPWQRSSMKLQHNSSVNNESSRKFPYVITIYQEIIVIKGEISNYLSV